MSFHFPPENIPSKDNNSHIGSPSPKKKSNNSTPSNAAEKNKILQQLISPNTRSKAGNISLTLGELIQLSENDNAHNIASNRSDNQFKETGFIEKPASSASSETTRPSDPKLEKKVTFARLLSKMSAEINVNCDIDVS